MNTARPLLTPEEVAEYLGIPLRSLYNWRYRGVGPRGYKVGKHVRYDAEDVRAWLQEHSDEAVGRL